MKLFHTFLQAAVFPKTSLPVTYLRWSANMQLLRTLSSQVDKFSQKKILASLFYLRGDETSFRQNVLARKSPVDTDLLFKVYEKYRKVSNQLDLARHERNVVSEQIPTLKGQPEREPLVQQAAALKQTISALEEEKESIVEKLTELLPGVPNWTHLNAPIGDYSQARVVKVHGKRREFSFPIQDHLALGTKLNIIDFQSGSGTTGHGFYFLKGAAALLELGLIQYGMQKLMSKGFLPVLTPDIVRTDVMEGCGFHPRGESTQVYRLSYHHGELCLAGTAEVPLAGMFMNKVVPFRDLPLRLVAFGRCYRAEAGGHGLVTRGLYRVHHFSKVEMFGITSSEMGTGTGMESEQLLQEFVGIQEEIASDLGLHYRVLEMPSEELGTSAYQKYDIEAWMPGRNEYGEITSASNCTEFQSRRLLIRYADPSGSRKTHYTHTVNATAVAVPRLIVAIMEHYQNEDGSIDLPEVLWPFVGMKRMKM
jgi:seryl-tRNA synthetase